MSVSFWRKPDRAGFLLFIRNVMAIPVSVLPDDALIIDYALNVAEEIVNEALAQVNGNIYTLAVYNLGGSNLINYAPDDPAATPPPVNAATFWADLRKKWNINDPIFGVVQSSSDESTSQSLVVPKQMEELTIMNLQQLKDPYGRAYLGFAQAYGPTIWGLTP